MNTSRFRFADRWLRRVSVVAALTFAALIGLTLGDAGAASRRPVPQSMPAAITATKLVRALRAAHTTTARTKAMYAIFQSLGIGVVSRTGKPIVTPLAPGSARSFYLYDFEVRGLASQFARGDVRGAEELAANLTASGLEIAPGKPFPARLAQVATRNVVRQALRKPASSRSLLPLILRELGRTRPGAARQDLAATPADEQKLDALQAWLIGADIRLGILAHIPAPRSAVGKPGRARSGRSLADDCENYKAVLDEREKQAEKRYGGKVGKYIADKYVIGQIEDEVTDQLTKSGTRWAIKNAPSWAVRGAWLGGKAVKLAGTVVEGLHGMALAYSIKVDASDQRRETHYGHGGQPGQVLAFDVTVTSQDDYGDLAARCGKLLGVELPRKGGVEGVKILWTQEDAELVPAHGALSCEGIICSSETDKSGVARLLFRPKTEEPFARLGFEKDAAGALKAIPTYQSAMDGGAIGGVAQFLTPKSVTLPWRVTYHAVKGVHISGSLHEHVYQGGDYPDQSTDAAIEVDVCSGDPRNAPPALWSGIVAWSGVVTPDTNSPDSYTFSQTFSVQDVRGGPPMWIEGQTPEMAGYEAMLPTVPGVRRFMLVPHVNSQAPPVGSFEVRIWPGYDKPKVAVVFTVPDKDDNWQTVEATDVTVTESQACG